MALRQLWEPAPQETMETPKSTQVIKHSTETYRQFGHRMAGLCDACADSLHTHLQIVYNNIKREQEADVDLQEQAQRDIQKQITSEKTALAQENTKLELSQTELHSIRERIQTIVKRIEQLKQQGIEKNHEAKANFVIGLCIIIPLTVYLFIFYSSTAYSAFFREIDFTDKIVDLALDPKALSLSWQKSLTAGLFVSLITFIFLALGFILHQFSLQESRIKYLKMTSIVLITFVFDTLLAFMIAKNMYDAQTLTILESRPEYTLLMAFMDVRFWLVIFCGFIAYIIWGLLFGFTMDSYNKLDLNKLEINSLKQQLEHLRNEEQAEKQNRSAIQQRIQTIEGNIATLEASRSSIRQYDATAILLELNNFFSGWLHYMNGASKPTAEFANANAIFETFKNNIKIS